MADPAELVLDARCALGEGPVWDDRTGVLWWVDIVGCRIHRLDPARGDHTTVPVGQPVSALALRRSGGAVLALRDGFGLLDDVTGEVTLLVPIGRDDPTMRMNDGGCDPGGRFWAGTMAFDLAPGRGTLYCLEPDADRTVRAGLDGLTLSNGLAWSADGRRMWFVDSATQRVDVIDFSPESGRLGSRRPFVDVDPSLGMPDGITIDAEGGIWVALWGGGAVRRYAPDGTLDQVIEVPASQVTSCAFGGSGLDVLYITTAREGLPPATLEAQPLAGGLFAARPGVPGLPTLRFGA